MPLTAAAAPADTDDPASVEQALRRELYLFALYRVFEAALLAMLVFSPAGTLISEPRDRLLAQGVAVAYLPMALALLFASRRDRSALAWQALTGVAVDIVVGMLITHAVPGAASGVAMLLLFNVGAASLFVPLVAASGIAAGAAIALVGEYVWTSIGSAAGDRPIAEVMMFSVSYFAMIAVSNLMGRQVRDSHQRADMRSAEAANLSEINGLIIRRMRTGVLLVDGAGFVRLANEAALQLLGDSDDTPRNLGRVAPELGKRLQQWKRDGAQDDVPVQIGSDVQIEVLPRFVRLLADGETTLVFLDDTSMVSRRAESLTLAAMGRFSASLAHEIRNPLAAISYATQLLEESADIGESDRRLLQIVHQQCMRTNGIVESVLGLARRERARPEHIDLVGFVRAFIDDFKQTMPEDVDSLTMTHQKPALPVLVDPRHLQQILVVLVQNALRYGRMPGTPARVVVRLELRDRMPVMEVLDRGPGIPDGVSAQLFRPFFTTSEHGTGLGLYIARELSKSNAASLDYVAVPGGGACFRLTLPGPDALLTA